MIKYGIRPASAAALALIPATMAGPASMASPQAPGAAPVAWVVNQSVRSATKGSVTPIDTATNAVITKIPARRNAIAVALAPDGKTAWVALNADRLGGIGQVIPVSTSTYQVGKPIKVASILPQTMAITPNGKTLYVVCAGNPGSAPQDVVPVSTATNTAGRAIDTGLQPVAIAISR